MFEQVRRLTNKITIAAEAKKEKKYFTVIILDVEKAFDKVWCRELVYKIKQNFPIQLFLLVKAYFENRWFFVKYQNSDSNLHAIDAGALERRYLDQLYTYFINIYS